MSRERIEPLETLLDAVGGPDVPLPARLTDLYGRLAFPAAAHHPHVYANFVTTLDGVAAIEAGGDGGGAISGFSARDRMVMGLLRAVADAVVVGAGTLRSVPDHLWTAEQICPELAAEYRELRASLGKNRPPLNVVVSGTGRLDLSLRVFSSGEVPVLIVTGDRGGVRLTDTDLPRWVRVANVGGRERVPASGVLEAIRQLQGGELILVEGGPRLLGGFFAERRVDELFLTLAPQVAGRDDAAERPGLVAGHRFLPDNPRWGSLVGVRRGGSHLFLRYAFGER